MAVSGQKPKNTKQAIIYFSLRWKLLIGFTLIFSVVFAIAFYWFYTFASTQALTRIQQDLLDTLNGASQEVSGDVLQGLIKEGKPNAQGEAWLAVANADENETPNLPALRDVAQANFGKASMIGFSDDPRYQQLMDQLQTIHNIEPRAWPYIFVKTEGERHITYIADLWARYDPSKATPFMFTITSKKSYKGLYELTLRLDSDGNFTPYTDQWGQWVSAYAPIKNTQGMAAIGIDFSADYVYQVQNAIRSQVVTAFAVAYLGLFVLVFLVSSALTKPIVKLTLATDALGDGDYSQNLSGMKSAGRFSDEIVKLTDVFAVMEKHNKNQAANHEAVLNNIADGVVVLDVQEGFLSANPALLSMVSKEDLQEIITKPLGKTIKWKRKVFSVTTAPVPGVGTVAVFRDETRRHEIERAKDSMLATASHELRTPLTAVMNYLEMLIVLTRMGKANTELFTEHLNRALENSQRLHRLILAILDQAQIHAGRIELKKQRFNLPEILETTRQLLNNLMAQKDLSYELIIHPNVPEEIVGDADRLQQVLVNLIGNAIKFTAQGGIRVVVHYQDAGKLTIAVSDTGPGIPVEQLPDIFEAFRRGSNYAYREHQGAGLGLSIVKEIVTLMNGHISVSSEIGVGSVFTVMIPVVAA